MGGVSSGVCACNFTHNQAIDETEIMHTINLTDDGFISHPSRFFADELLQLTQAHPPLEHALRPAKPSAAGPHGKEAGMCEGRRSPTACACSHRGAGGGADCDLRGLAACRG